LPSIAEKTAREIAELVARVLRGDEMGDAPARVDRRLGLVAQRGWRVEYARREPDQHAAAKANTASVTTSRRSSARLRTERWDWCFPRRPPRPRLRRRSRSDAPPNHHRLAVGRLAGARPAGPAARPHLAAGGEHVVAMASSKSRSGANQEAARAG